MGLLRIREVEDGAGAAAAYIERAHPTAASPCQNMRRSAARSDSAHLYRNCYLPGRTPSRLLRPAAEEGHAEPRGEDFDLNAGNAPAQGAMKDGGLEFARKSGRT